MTRVLLLLATVLALLGSHRVAEARDWGGHKPCREHPDLSGACFAVRGGMSYWNGNPSVRIRKLGTKRMLGVSEGRFFVPGYVNLPESIESQLDWDSELVGDFLVCPFTEDEPDVMRLVCVESATSLRKEPRERPGP
jgi:hypothetical protein